ncbi:MAG: cysteine synthase family protein [SAR202 cluster bacterium]|nr:cysteine synthase family protein [SAR202 cluster bacterium]
MRQHPVDLLNLIGGTPLVELRQFAPKPGIRIWAKLEGQNPSGSVKDRIVLAMVRAAIARGRLKPGQPIVEASTGNTAIALAMIGKRHGHPVRVVVPHGVVPSIADVLRLHGAELRWCEPSGGMRGAVETAHAMAEHEGFHELDQFTNAENVAAHYETTGAEIVGALDAVDVFVAGIGTGGTVMGVGKRLRERFPNVRVVGVEPRLGDRLQGIRNIAEGFVPPLLDLAQLDGRFLVESATAIRTARRVVEAEGIFAGVSSGATLSAALRLAERMDKGNIVVMFSDGGWKYLPARPWQAADEGDAALDEVHWW